MRDPLRRAAAVGLSIAYALLLSAAAADAATLTLIPTSGPAGTTIAAKGRGFTPRITGGTIKVEGKVVANFRTYSSGKFGKRFTAPASPNPSYTVVARDPLGVEARSTFTLTGQPLPPDSDGDGVPDASDLCPNQPGPVSNNGCPLPQPTGYQTAPVDGGTSYYGQFTNSLPSSPDYFPIGVWGAYNFTPENVAKDKDVGINTYVWNADTAAWGQTNIAAAGGMYTLQEVTDTSNIGAHTRGWMLADEVDMTAGPGNDTTNCNGPHPQTGAPSGYQIMRQKLAQVPDGRVTYANYGKGLVGPQWETDAQASCFVNAFQDISSADLYWHTDPNESFRPQSGTSWGYGQTVDRMRFLDGLAGGRHPIWNFVEVGWPWGETPGTNGLDKPTPAEIRGAVWHSIIAGARGITYFQHSFTGPCQSHHALRETGSACYGAVIDMVRSVNAQIKQLAPVLNSPTVTSGLSASSSVRVLGKLLAGGNLHVFAGSRQSTASTATFTVQPGPTVAEVVGESRTIPINASGQFTDSFANGNAVHIYRITQ